VSHQRYLAADIVGQLTIKRPENRINTRQSKRKYDFSFVGWGAEPAAWSKLRFRCAASSQVVSLQH
jgi:hypothetical protein